MMGERTDPVKRGDRGEGYPCRWIVVGAPLVGWLSDRWLRRRRLPSAAFTLCLAVSVGALVLTFFVTETRCRNIWRGV